MEYSIHALLMVTQGHCLCFNRALLVNLGNFPRYQSVLRPSGTVQTVHIFNHPGLDLFPFQLE